MGKGYGTPEYVLVSTNPTIYYVLLPNPHTPSLVRLPLNSLFPFPVLTLPVTALSLKP